LPLLEREFNPAIRQVLAETAEIAREEEAYWKTQVEIAFAEVMHAGGVASESHLRIAALAQFPPALQRHLVRRAMGAEALDFQQVEQVLALMESGSGAEVELRGQWRVQRAPRCPQGADGFAHPKADPELVFTQAEPRPQHAGTGSVGGLVDGYEYVLPIPGEVYIQEIGIRLHASVFSGGKQPSGEYGLLDARVAGDCLRVRNWRAGDRFWPSHTGSPKKVKELLQVRRVSGRTRALWPVAVNGAGELVWMKGFSLPERFLAGQEDAAVLIEAEELGPGKSA
jgi:tRNA(Ile)-lysidine synthase